MDKVKLADFQKLDIRVGTVVEAEVPEWSHWVMKLVVNFGKGIGKKIIFAGIMKFFKPEELVGKQYPFVINLEPKKIGSQGDKSYGMIIMAVPKEDEETPPHLLKIGGKVPNGTRVM